MPGPKKAVSAIKRAWTNQVLARVGRHPVVPPAEAEPVYHTNPTYTADPQPGASSSGGKAEPAFRTNPTYTSEADEGPKIGKLPDTPDLAFAGPSRNRQFERLLDTFKGKDVEETKKNLVDYTTKVAKDDQAMIVLATAAAHRQLDRELKEPDADGNLVFREDQETARNALFRSNNDWSQIGVAYCKAEPEGKKYIEQLQKSMNAKLSKLKQPVEIRPYVVKEELEKGDPAKPGAAPKPPRAVTPEMVQAVSASRYKTIIDMMLSTLDGIMAARIPKSMAVMIGATTQAARANDVGQNEIRKLVGAFLMLRIVNPALIDGTRKLNKKTGMTEPSVSSDQSRMVLNITKATQNMANGVMVSSKEPELQPLMDALKNREAAMNAWFDRVANDGVALVAKLTKPGVADSLAGAGSDAAGEALDDDDLAPGEKGKQRTS